MVRLHPKFVYCNLHSNLYLHLKKLFPYSTWAVWLHLGHSRTSWPLTWAYKKIPLVTDYWNLLSLSSIVEGFFCFFVLRISFCIFRVGLLYSHISPIAVSFCYLRNRKHCCDDGYLLFSLQVRHVGGPFIQPQSRGRKVKRSGWVTTSSLSACPLRDTW